MGRGCITENPTSPRIVHPSHFNSKRDNRQVSPLTTLASAESYIKALSPFIGHLFRQMPVLVFSLPTPFSSPINPIRRKFISTPSPSLEIATKLTTLPLFFQFSFLPRTQKAPRATSRQFVGVFSPKYPLNF